MFQNVYLIFNPVSGQGNPETDLTFIRSVIEESCPLTVLETSADEPVETLVRAAIDDDADCVVASGGDGTVSTVAGALIGCDIPLGIVPRGTANAIATAFSISNNLAVACETILTGNPQKIDVAQCNQYPLLLLAGIGLEADVISQANRQLKNKIGSAAYILSAFQQVRDLSVFEVEMETPERIITVEASGITVANAAPATSVLAHGPSTVLPHDGLVDVTIFAPQGTASAIAASYNLFQSAMNKQSSNREDVGYFRCSSIKISTTPEQKVVVDGEMRGTTPVEVRCIPRGLTLITPKGGNFDPPERLEGLPNLAITYKNQTES
ncbi:MAG: YegS/Rv2252/BmrU family lipid kinase [Phormidesmis sp.]